MQGAVQIEGCEMEGFNFTFILISRRSKDRAGEFKSVVKERILHSNVMFIGMRYQRRGINEAGDVANFVETEQIVLFEREDEKHIASFVQTRGSSKCFYLLFYQYHKIC
jgi:transposase